MMNRTRDAGRKVDLRPRLRESVEEVLATFVENDVTVATDSDVTDSDALASLIRFSDAWFGAVTVACRPGMAREIAAVMYEQLPESLSEEEVEDALGEIANMIAGHMKSVLPIGTRLSVPTIHRAADIVKAVPGHQVSCRCAFRCPDELVAVTLYESRAEKLLKEEEQ